ncbi:MAG: DnaA regulatory inactivator Hda [Gammaproteobacteria bacterium]
MQTQLNLDIQLRVASRLNNFITGSPQAQELKTRLEQLIELPREQPIFIYGAPGSGKSHLLQGTCHLARQQGIVAGYLPLSELTRTTPDLLASLSQLELLCVDDVHSVGGHGEWENALFNLYNESQQQQRLLIFAGQYRPADCGIELADLSSRLSWGLIYALPALDDQQKKLLVKQRGDDLGLAIDEATCDYIMLRCDRETGKLMQFLDRIDQHSLAKQRRITVPLVRELL